MMKVWMTAVLMLLAEPAFAQAPAGLGDSKEPIEITADELEVLQQQQKAIFSGNVEAVQGKVTLKSQTMTVYYQQDGQNKAEGGNQISRIDVDGGVVLNTATETARGSKGSYLVAEKKIRMQGNVVLNKDKNEIRGDALEYDLTTGRSKMVSVGKPAAPGEEAPKGRVKGIFIPGSK